ncbi:MAG: hypothetical protein PHQ05_07020, partial [Sterolibacterium sp.]|nr:hypothetical protein [Sterolibacterium sp.]
MDNLDQQNISDDLVNHSPLEPEARGAMTFPLPRQSLVMKSRDGPQSRRARNTSNIFPFLVSLQHRQGNRPGKLFVDSAVFFNSPHATLWLYHIWYVNWHPGLCRELLDLSGSVAGELSAFSDEDGKRRRAKPVADFRPHRRTW